MVTGQSDPGRAGRVNATIVGFTAAAAGMGRTNAITNIAWIMAAAGVRVLVVDWSTDSTAEHDYLRPFHTGTVELVDALADRLEILDGAPAWLTEAAMLQRYGVPRVDAEDAHIDVLTSRDPDRAGLPTEASGAGWVAQWRGILGRLPYDYVLVDSSTGMSATGAARDAELLDIAILCFLPRQRSIEQAARYAAQLVAEAVVRIRVIVLPMQFDDSRPARAQHSRGLIQDAFARLLTARAGHDVVEIPYHPYDEYDEALAVLLDDPADSTSLLASYHRLTAAILDRTTTVVPAPDLIRDRYRRQLGLESAAAPPTIGVVYAPKDRPWADWVRQRLQRGGADIVLLPVGFSDIDVSTNGTVLIESPELTRSLGTSEFSAPNGGSVVRLVTQRDTKEHAVAEPDTIVVGNSQERAIGTRLLAAFELVDKPGAAGIRSIRFPGALPVHTHTNLLPRNPAFTGRDADLETLRDRTLMQGTDGRWTLSGPPGIGKSEIAREYAHRFGFDYDIVWWVPAHNVPAARASLLQLANQCGFSESGDAVRELLTRLSSNDLGRWLLVFDNVDDPAALIGLQPASAAGHLLATTRVPAPAASRATIAVGSFGIPESSSLLQDNVSGLSKEDASGVATAVEQLPLALGIAAAWLREATATTTALGATVEQAAAWSVAEFLTRIYRTRPTVPPATDAAQTPPIVVSVVHAVLDTLERSPLGELAVGLARMCAFLSPDGISLRLLRSAPVARQLAKSDVTGILASDAAEIDSVLWAGDRHGLFNVDWGEPATLVMHRVVQATIKSIMTSAEQFACQQRVLTALADFAPTETEHELPESRAKFIELQRHLFASGALTDRSDGVRRWIVNHARHVYVDGDGPAWQYAAWIVADVAERWQAEFGANDELLLRLKGQLANIQRSLGRNDIALGLDDAVLVGQRGALGSARRQTLISTRGRSADLRGLGRFDEAFADDHVAWDRFREILGDDHPDTRRAANNLATSAFLTGDVRFALELELDNLDRRTRLFGDSQGTWFATARVGVYRRELGQYELAAQLLRTAWQRMRLLDVRDNHPDMLLISWNLAVADRRIENLPAAKDRDSRTVKAYRMLFGERHPYSLGSSLSLAADHHALGGSDVAVELAERCLAGYQDFDTDHPFTSVCRLNLALYLRAVGRSDDALAASTRAMDGLRAKLGDGHPWTLIASVNKASLLAGRGDLKAASELAEPTNLTCRELLGDDHPYTTASWDNLVRLRQARSGNGTSIEHPWPEMDVDVPTT